jgi:hypothetical protein
MLKIKNPYTRKWREINKEYYKEYMRIYMNNYRNNIKLKMRQPKSKKIDKSKTKFEIIKKNIIIEF